MKKFAQSALTRAIVNAPASPASASVGSIANLAAVKPQGKGTRNTSDSQKKGQAQMGSELATRVWAYITAESVDMREYARSIFLLSNEGRAAFRSDLDAHKNAARKAADEYTGRKVQTIAKVRTVVAEGDKGRRAWTSQMIATAFKKCSQLRTISKAADEGGSADECVAFWNAPGEFTFANGRVGVGCEAPGVTWETMRFANVCTYAVAGYGTATTGQKPLSPAVKAQRYILSQIAPRDYQAVLTALTKLVARVHNNDEAAAALKALLPAKAKAEAKAA